MGGLRVSLSVPPDWTAVEPIRHALALYAHAVLKNVREAETIAMVAAELLENAVKHSDPDARDIGITIVRDDEGLTIDVTNTVADAGVAALRDRLDWLASRGDPQKAWTEVLLGFGDSAAADEHGGLGLARIACEGGCRLSVRTPEPGRLTVRAERPGL